MNCPYCDGTGFCEEPFEYRYECEMCDEDGNAICGECGDFATRQDDEGWLHCDAHYFKNIEQDAA